VGKIKNVLKLFHFVAFVFGFLTTRHSPNFNCA